ncbi:hypothetical protein BOTBODRAFT_192476 [Botryobasidium botryosum FD-172 SS1]|uniref:LIM zinc-binding domain-containing protein n=1 Tax=Botryobasidium botryosum (strain FD-172 SS1) TaxID=930990 RepID=A0A067M688_BOTB1|nr:hypothetical protein BOTBODRAFT_192476 [Botryobasidium botryosum FD-172 SS1]
MSYYYPPPHPHPHPHPQAQPQHAYQLPPSPQRQYPQRQPTYPPPSTAAYPAQQHPGYPAQRQHPQAQAYYAPQHQRPPLPQQQYAPPAHHGPHHQQPGAAFQPPHMIQHQGQQLPPGQYPPAHLNHSHPSLARSPTTHTQASSVPSRPGASYSAPPPRNSPSPIPFLPPSPSSVSLPMFPSPIPANQRPGTPEPNTTAFLPLAPSQPPMSQQSPGRARSGTMPNPSAYSAPPATAPAIAAAPLQHRPSQAQSRRPLPSPSPSPASRPQSVAPASSPAIVRGQTTRVRPVSMANITIPAVSPNRSPSPAPQAPQSQKTHTSTPSHRPVSMSSFPNLPNLSGASSALKRAPTAGRPLPSAPGGGVSASPVPPAPRNNPPATEKPLPPTRMPVSLSDPSPSPSPAPSATSSSVSSSRPASRSSTPLKPGTNIPNWRRTLSSRAPPSIRSTLTSPSSSPAGSTISSTKTAPPSTTERRSPSPSKEMAQRTGRVERVDEVEEPPLPQPPAQQPAVAESKRAVSPSPPVVQRPVPPPSEAKNATPRPPSPRRPAPILNPDVEPPRAAERPARSTEGLHSHRREAAVSSDHFSEPQIAPVQASAGSSVRKGPEVNRTSNGVSERANAISSPPSAPSRNTSTIMRGSMPAASDASSPVERYPDTQDRRRRNQEQQAQSRPEQSPWDRPGWGQTEQPAQPAQSRAMKFAAMELEQEEQREGGARGGDVRGILRDLGLEGSEPARMREEMARSGGRDESELQRARREYAEREVHYTRPNGAETASLEAVDRAEDIDHEEGLERTREERRASMEIEESELQRARRVHMEREAKQRGAEEVEFEDHVERRSSEVKEERGNREREVLEQIEEEEESELQRARRQHAERERALREAGQAREVEQVHYQRGRERVREPQAARHEPSAPRSPAAAGRTWPSTVDPLLRRGEAGAPSSPAKKPIDLDLDLDDQPPAPAPKFRARSRSRPGSPSRDVTIARESGGVPPPLPPRSPSPTKSAAAPVPPPLPPRSPSPTKSGAAAAPPLPPRSGSPTKAPNANGNVPPLPPRSPSPTKVPSNAAPVHSQQGSSPLRRQLPSTPIPTASPIPPSVRSPISKSSHDVHRYSSQRGSTDPAPHKTTDARPGPAPPVLTSFGRPTPPRSASSKRGQTEQSQLTGYGNPNSVSVSVHPPAPSINVDPPKERGNARDVPSISFSTDSVAPPSPPSIMIDSAPSISFSPVPSVPSISIDVSPPPPTPSIEVSAESPTRRNTISPSSVNTSPVKDVFSPAFANIRTNGPTTPRGLRCAGCECPIVGRIVSAMGRRWHPTCFKCVDCGDLLEHVSSFEHEGKAYCHLDYHEHFAPRCYHCRTPIIDERFIVLDDPALGGKRYYHELHFFCAECGDPFLDPSRSSAAPPGTVPPKSPYLDDDDDVGFTVYQGHPYCEACHVRLRMPRCGSGARGGIVPGVGCGRSIRQEAVEALGRKWHRDCFVCESCKKPFDDPSFFQRGDHAYCDPCYRIMLKSEL